MSQTKMQIEAEREVEPGQNIQCIHVLYIMDEFLHNRAEQYTDCDYFVGKRPVGGNQCNCVSLNGELDNAVTHYTY